MHDYEEYLQTMILPLLLKVIQETIIYPDCQAVVIIVYNLRCVRNASAHKPPTYCNDKKVNQLTDEFQL